MSHEGEREHCSFHSELLGFVSFTVGVLGSFVMGLDINRLGFVCYLLVPPSSAHMRRKRGGGGGGRASPWSINQQRISLRNYDFQIFAIFF